jgi:hypothetical protein
MDTCKPFPLPGNSVYFELAGSASTLGSINYERKIFNKNSFYLTGRVGVGYGYFFDYNILSSPIVISGIVRVFRAISYEFGLGMTLMRIGNKLSESNGQWTYENDLAPTALIGIRVQKKSGFLFRFDFTPIYTNYNIEDPKKNLYPVFGISFGYSFGKK